MGISRLGYNRCTGHAGITNHYSTAEVAVCAVNAGADIVLMPLETQASIKALQHAVDDGIIKEERVMHAEEHRRFAESVLKKNSDASIVDQPAHALLALRAADKAISLEGNQSLLPLVQFKHVGVFAVIDEKESDTATTFFRYLAEATEMNIDFGYIDGTIEERDLAGLNEGVHNAECIVFVFFTTAVAFRNSIPGFEYVPGVMNRLSENKKRIVIACGSPYGISELSADLRINTFSDTIPSIAALVLRLIGRIPG